MESRLATVLQLETSDAGVRSAALGGSPIDVRSALDRQSRPLVVPGRETRAAGSAPSGDRADEEAPEWPDDVMEAAMSAEAAARAGGFGGGGRAPKSRKNAVETLDGGPLPDLEQLIAQIPAALQNTMEDLFRVKFSGVRRVPVAVLKAAVDATAPTSVSVADDLTDLAEGIDPEPDED